MTPPKDIAENLEYRKRVLELCQTDKEAQRQFWVASSRDIVFWLDTFGWTFANLLYPEAPDRPFICWPYQENFLRTLDGSIGQHDVLIEKSRDMGMTWLVMANFLHRWLFKRSQSLLIASRKEQLVDETGNSDCLMWKLDYLLGHLPLWMRPKCTRNLLVLRNDVNGSTINGESTNNDIARGGRRQAIFLDEFPAVENGYDITSGTLSASKCRIFGGTPQGASGAYYDQRRKMLDENPEWILSLHWSLHPHKSAGLYKDEAGKLRSPWYDNECRRAVSPQEIAQELDIDYAASSWKALDPQVLAELIKDQPRDPFFRGELSYVPGMAGEWMQVGNGKLLLWTHIANGGPPEDTDYVCGCDISMGKAGEMSSRSVASVWSRKTFEKVAEFKTANLDPVDFAEYAVAICKWFKGKNGGAHLIWEVNGPGNVFGKRVIENMRYQNIFYRGTEARVGRPKTKIPGFATTHDSKNQLLQDYFKALREKTIINRSAEALKEVGEYDHFPTGEIAHCRSKVGQDPTATGKNHGDIVIADALAWRALQDFQTPQQVAATQHAPLSCYHLRRANWEKDRKQKLAYR